MLPDLLSQIPPDQELGSVTADGAYDTRKCHDAIAAREAHAVIPPRKNAKMWKPDTPGARARNEAVRSSKYLGRALWRHLTGYHRRSRCRNQDALCETPRSAPLGAGLQSASCGDPDPSCNPKRFHSSWHTMYRRRRLSPSGERGSTISGRFVQQSHEKGRSARIYLIIRDGTATGSQLMC